MNITVFCRREPRHIYFANSLCKHLSIDRIFVEQKSSIFNDERLSNENTFFFGNKEGCFDRSDLICEVFDINCDAIDTYLSQNENLLICTFGCSIIKVDSAFTEKVNILNLHTGILPEYRGVHCTFWALYNNQPDKLGGSIHLINRKIDAVDIMTCVFPHISPNDNEERLFNKTVKLGVEEFVRAACFVNKYKKIIAKPQHPPGNIYFAKDRTKTCEMELESMLKEGLLHTCCLYERIERFYEYY